MMSNAVLYTFPMSVWAAVPDLALVELGYSGTDVEKKIVNLAEGANFDPAFLNINPLGTLPTLTAGGEVYTTTAEVTNYLMKNAKTKVKASTESDLAFIDKIHANEYDPNFPILSARNDDELSAKSAGFAMQFLANRQSALEKHSVHEDGVDHKVFYDSKIQGNGHVLSIYQSKTSPSTKENFFEMSNAHWDNLRKFILEDLRDDLPAQGFLGGEVPGEADFHVAAWLARIAAAGGAKKTDDGLKMLQKELGSESESPIPPNVASYWNAWVKRQSWAQVYGQDLH